MADKLLADIYYLPRGYWRGLAAAKKLATVAHVSEQVARDVASHYKEAEPLVDKSSKEVALALDNIYKQGPLTWPNLLQVDPGREFMGSVLQLLAKRKVQIQRGHAGNHREQGIVECFNCSLAECLFGVQYAQELLLAVRGSSERSAEWVRALPNVIAALNEVTRLMGRKPVDTTKEPRISHAPSLLAACTVGLDEPILGSDAQVRYLYVSSPGEHELEGGCWRATDPVWSLMVHTVRNVI